jgi:hypothetical protein
MFPASFLGRDYLFSTARYRPLGTWTHSRQGPLHATDRLALSKASGCEAADYEVKVHRPSEQRKLWGFGWAATVTRKRRAKNKVFSILL